MKPRTIPIATKTDKPRGHRQQGRVTRLFAAYRFNKGAFGKPEAPFFAADQPECWDRTGSGATAFSFESFLCAYWKSVILRMNRTGLLTFVAEASAGSARLALGPGVQSPSLTHFD